MLETIEKLNYRAHPGASSLRSRRTMQLAHPMPAIELQPGNAIALEFVQALISAAGDANHHVLLTASGDDTTVIEDLMRSGRVDGFVFSNLEPHDRRVRLVAERGFPFACFGRTESDLPQCWVDIDNAGGTSAATQHLIAKGHTSIGYLGFGGQSYWDQERLSGYHQAMALANLTPHPVLVDHDDTRSSCVSALLDGPHLTAVVTGSDALAAVVYSGAERRGMMVGKDLDVTGFDGSIIARSLTPRLSTLTIPTVEIAVLAVNRVLDERDGPTGQPGQIVDLPLVLGESA